MLYPDINKFKFGGSLVSVASDMSIRFEVLFIIDALTVPCGENDGFS